MIDVSPLELRIGNYIMVKETQKWELVKLFAPLSINYRAPHAYEPIPLNPEILEKCGFSKWGIDEWFMPYKRNDEEEYTNNLCIIEFDEVGFVACIRNRELEITSLNLIQYVHQLQNIFYAIVGEELTITL